MTRKKSKRNQFFTVATYSDECIYAFIESLILLIIFILEFLKLFLTNFNELIYIIFTLKELVI